MAITQYTTTSPPPAMSISRRRVGSVSQRNDSPLPPLDIQSIQMPSNPQNALALRTAALSSTRSLFQMASSLRKRLRNLEEFAPFLEQPPNAPSLDVVSHMCHVFRLGSSLCVVYNHFIPSLMDPKSSLYVADLPKPERLEYEYPSFVDSPDGVRNWAKRPQNKNQCQRYIASFLKHMKLLTTEHRWNSELWSLHELWGKSLSSDAADAEAYDSSGLTKVFQTVEAMLDNLAETTLSPTTATPTTPYGMPPQSFTAMGHAQSSARHSYEGAAFPSNSSSSLVNGVDTDSPEPGPGPSTMGSQAALHDGADNAFKTVEELVNSERTYVQELEILERYSVEIQRAELVSAETVYALFSNLRQILDFQRKFLIKLETEYEPIEEFGPSAWNKGRWGRPFLEMEKEFECYGPFCANFMDSLKVAESFMFNLKMGQELPDSQRPCLHPERELQAFMIKPVQRITKYGLLLGAIKQATDKHPYPYRDELEEGINTVRRIAKDINETTNLKEKQAAVRDLNDRVEDWKNHKPERFGDLHLDDQFTVTKADSTREYHVYLFEKMMLCCKEVTPDKKVKTAKNTLRKDKTISKGGPQPRPRLALKGRIFVSNIIGTHLVCAPANEPYGPPRIKVVWSVPAKAGDAEQHDVEDSFIMSGRSDEVMRKWCDKIQELSKNSSKDGRNRHNSHASDGAHRGQYWSSSFAPPTPGTEHGTFFTPQTPANGHQFLPDEGEEAEMPPPPANLNGLAIYGVQGVPGIPFPRDTTYPRDHRKYTSQQSIPPAQQADMRPRAVTEDHSGPSMAAWLQQNQPQAPPLPRITSGPTPESSWAPGHGPRHASHSQTRPPPTDDKGGYPPNSFRQGPMARTASGGVSTSSRGRSASSPNAYQPPPQSAVPPLPPPNGAAAHAPHWHHQNNSVPYTTSGSATSSSTGLGSTPGGTAFFATNQLNGKRSSAESQTTETSDTSSQSPRTPYNNAIPGDVRGTTPVSRQNSSEATTTAPAATILIKVRSGDSNFVIGITTTCSFQHLYEKVVKKLRLCSGRTIETALKIKWLDEEGDEVLVSDDQDVSLMIMERTANHIQLIAT